MAQGSGLGLGLGEEAQLDGLALGGDDLRGGFGAEAVKNDHAISRTEAKHVYGVVRFALVELRRRGVPLIRCKVKSVH